MSAGVRVLHVIASLSPKQGGTTSSLLHLVKALAEVGVTSEILATDDDGPGERLAPDAPERAMAGRHYVEKTRNFYTYAPGLGPKLKALLPGFDLVHIHGLFSHANTVAGRVCKAAGLPYVVTPHGMVNRYGLAHKPLQKKLSMALVERPLLRRAAMVHLTSQTEAQHFAELGLDCQTQTIPLPAEPTAQGDAARFLARHPSLQGKQRVVFVGRLNPVKNLPSLVAAMPILRASCPDAVLVIAGDGDQRRALEVQAKAAGVPASFLGFVQGGDLADTLAAADVFVLPSHSESFGLAALEALGAGCPLVLSEGVAVAQDLSRAGFAWVGAGTPDGLAGAITAALVARPQWDADAARRHVADAFSPSKVASDLLAVYQRAVQA